MNWSGTAERRKLKAPFSCPGTPRYDQSPGDLRLERPWAAWLAWPVLTPDPKGVDHGVGGAARGLGLWEEAASVLLS
jgi:hypothetical protein